MQRLYTGSAHIRTSNYKSSTEEKIKINKNKVAGLQLGGTTMNNNSTRIVCILFIWRRLLIFFRNIRMCTWEFSAQIDIQMCWIFRYVNSREEFLFIILNVWRITRKQACWVHYLLQFSCHTKQGSKVPSLSVDINRLLISYRISCVMERSKWRYHQQIVQCENNACKMRLRFSLKTISKNKGKAKTFNLMDKDFTLVGGADREWRFVVGVVSLIINFLIFYKRQERKWLPVRITNPLLSFKISKSSWQQQRSLMIRYVVTWINNFTSSCSLFPRSRGAECCT